MDVQRDVPPTGIQIRRSEREVISKWVHSTVGIQSYATIGDTCVTEMNVETAGYVPATPVRGSAKCRGVGTKRMQPAPAVQHVPTLFVRQHIQSPRNVPPLPVRWCLSCCSNSPVMDPAPAVECHPPGTVWN